MKDISEPFETLTDDPGPPGQKRGPLLYQLPPSLTFDVRTLDHALRTMLVADKGKIIIEARYRSWSSQEAVDLLETHKIDHVFADPAPVWPAETFSEPPRCVRLHGNPESYYYAYGDDEIRFFSKLVAPEGWCVSDNTASSAAIENALTMKCMPAGHPVRKTPG
jgi:uncharacterized protein YecE (DUF72 family)